MVELLNIAPFHQLLSHFRFLLTLRSREGNYRSLILFRLSTVEDTPTCGPDSALGTGMKSGSSATGPDSAYRLNTNSKQLYAMEASCPHLGADLTHAEIEECDNSVVAVCPWHRYDFDLRTGKSETGLKACTFSVYVNVNSSGAEIVSLETPEEGSGWRLVELRPVSEEFADPPPNLSLNAEDSSDPKNESTLPVEDEPVVPLDSPPKTLMQWAVLILNTPNPALKVERTKHAVHLFRTGKLSSIGHKSPSSPRPPDVPSRDASWTRNLKADPAKVKNRRNRAIMLHALANIEQWAIDLAWDIMARFGPSHLDIPTSFFHDFTKMALDEAKHFSLLTSRLSTISPSTPYGSMPVHASLWESAAITVHSLRARLAIIHLVHEARGLDVNPGTIERFRRAGDMDTVEVMEIIHADEVTHVTAGHRWFMWICEHEGMSRDDGGIVRAFREEVRKGWRGEIKGPFNVEAREVAGMTREFYENLRGELGIERVDEPNDNSQSKEQSKNGVHGGSKEVEAAPANIAVGYESGASVNFVHS